MPTFGQHETAQRLHLSGVGAIYALKADEKKIIKVLQPPEGIWTEEQLRFEIDGFLLRAKTQRIIAKSSKNWTPVHETSAIRAGSEGSSESAGGDAMSRVEDSGGAFLAGGAYAILDRYERSCQSLLDGRVNINNDDLRNIISSVIRGLIDLRKTVSRPHGNLKPANILLANSTDLSAATVHLTDPAPDGILNANSSSKDLADLAKIFYELVHLRPYQGGTIGPSKEWSKLGPNGEDWRKLCSVLLDSGAPADERDLEKILPKIDTWRRKPPKSKLPLIAAVLCFLVIAGGVATWLLMRPAKVDFDQGRWEKLCLSYYSWFDDFSNMDDSTKQKFLTDPRYPAQAVKLLNDAGDLTPYDPKTIAGERKRPEELAANPTDDAKMPSRTKGPAATKKGDDLIDSIAAAMGPQSWPLLIKLDQTAKTYDQQGWAKPAAAIHGIVADAQPPAIPVQPADITERFQTYPARNMVSRIDAAITAAKTVTSIDGQWQQIQAEIRQLPQTQVPLIDAFPKFATDLPRSAPATSQPGQPVTGTLDDVKALAANFAQIETVLHQLVSDLNRKDREIVFAELAKDPAAQLPPDGHLTPVLYEKLPDIVRGYVKLQTDPRNGAPWDQALADVDEGMIKPINEANPQDPHLAQLTERRGTLQKEILAWASYAPIEKNRTQLETLVAKAKDALAQLDEDGNNWSAQYKVDPIKYLADQRALITTSPLAKATPAVYQQWQKAHNALLAKASANPQALKKWQVYKSVDNKFKTLQSTYGDFDAAIPSNVPGLSTIGGNDWRHTIASRVSTVYREATLTDLMTNPALKWSDDLPQTADPAYQSFHRERLAAYDSLRRQAIALLADYTTIQDRLDHLDLLPNQPTPKAPTWHDLYSAWTQSDSALVADPIVTAALKPITDRVTNLLTLDHITGYKLLLEKTSTPAGGEGGGTEVVLTAWRKLGSAPINESLPVLADEDAAESHLIALANNLAKANILDQPRLNALGAEIKAQRPFRWHRWTDTLTSAAPIETALDHRADFGVTTLNPKTDASMIFNDAFYQLRKAYDGNLKEVQLKPIAQNFITAVNRMSPAVSQNPGIQAMLDKMAKSLKPESDDAGSSSGGAGPQLAGWEYDPVPNKDTPRFYFPSKAAPKYVLEFRRIPDQVNNKTVYICTTDISLGLFADILNRHVTDLDNTTKPGKEHWLNTGDDPWKGPRGWKIQDGKLVPNDDWLFKVPQMGDSPYYPAAKPEPPGIDMPVQQVSPWVVMYTARLLGCRLPTSAEWTAAYDRIEANAGPKDSWNLRGVNWQTQQNYSVKMSANGMDYADAGMFKNQDILFGTISSVTGGDAKPWYASDLAKINSARFSDGPDIYKGSAIWFRKVGVEPGKAPPGSGAGAIHDLVGNVAQFVFDDPSPKALKPADIHPTTDDIDNMLANTKNALFVIGGSALSPPQMSFITKQPVDPDFASTASGFADVGFRLAYTAPIDSIVDVLATVFKEPKYLPGPNAK